MMKTTAKTIHSSHAVVMARRALVAFLYSQVSRAYTNSDSIFVTVGGRLQLHSFLSVHLYISTVPCGDVREVCSRPEMITFSLRPDTASCGSLKESRWKHSPSLQ